MDHSLVLKGNMITKAQATQMANEYQRGFAQRLLDTLESNARFGVTGTNGAYPYPPAVPAPFLTQVQTALTNAGWTVVVDGVGFTITVS